MPQGVSQKSFIRGLIATAGVMSQPKGSVARLSNMLMTRRGSLRTCDGSQLLHAFNGALTSGRGRITASFLFAPIGAPRYYLAIIKALDLQLGPPKNLAVATAGGGSLAAATYFYVVTALDGAGGETTISNEVSIATGANGKNTLTWNLVPNAVSYNVYRSTSAGTEILLAGGPAPGLPTPQPAFNTITVTFVDDGTTFVAGTSFPCVGIGVRPKSGGGTQILVNLLNSATIPANAAFSYAGGTNPAYNGTYTSDNFTQTGTSFTAQKNGGNPPLFTSSAGGTITLSASITPPGADNTQQTALFKMPVIQGSPAILPVSYNNSNIVALYPADAQIQIDGGGGGGSGGGGGTGGGGSTGGGTISGGIAGNVSLIPQFVEFTNQAIIALGNGFPPQVFSDPTPTTDHPATIANISTITVDAFGVVTVTTSTPHGFPTTGVVNPGSNVIIAGVVPGPYNGTFPVIQIVSATVFKVRNVAAIGSGAGASGTTTTTTIPLTSNFTPAIPIWSATTVYAINSVVQPSPSNSHFYKAIQAGTSGGAQPAFPTGTGQRVVDGSVVWQEAGLVNSTAPPPPGGAHLAVYSGALWVWDTSPTNTVNGLDGPCSLRMSDVNNAGSWNPINQAFLDKDDGTEGTGITSFTITAQGIPPQGSLVAFKNFATYQILGLFGAANFAIQRVKTDLGCTAPRTIQYLPGFGIARYAHLGFGLFDGVDDRVVSEEIRPYLFPSNDLDLSDITVVDSSFVAVAWACQTASPPMYAVAMPIGASGGNLTRVFIYDMVLKAWGSVDLPFAISSISQFRTTIANPVTVMGSSNTGELARWQAGDILWDTGGTGARTPSIVNWSAKSPTLAGNDLDQTLYLRRLNFRGINTNSTAGLTVTIILDGIQQPAYVSPVLPSGDFEIEVAIGQDVLRAEAIVAGSGDVELFGWTWGTVAKPAGRPLAVT